MKTDLFIKILDSKDYKEANLHIYQRLIGKLIYFLYGTRPDISFVIGQLSRHNTNLKKDTFKPQKE